MSNTALEQRIQTLEQQMQDVLTRIQSAPAPARQPKTGGEVWECSMTIQ
ncbi:MAG UNVERIFIED_CONTAM: hypothetical protein LVR18_02180 [Planctomycetaceae bacterium]|jgi:hypothetical protein